MRLVYWVNVSESSGAGSAGLSTIHGLNVVLLLALELTVQCGVRCGPVIRQIIDYAFPRVVHDLCILSCYIRSF